MDCGLMPTPVIYNSADSFILPRAARIGMGAATRNSPRKPAFRAERGRGAAPKIRHIMPDRRPFWACFEAYR